MVGRALCFKNLIAEPPADVDVLIMEGTTLLRPTEDGDLTSEAAVEDRMTEILGSTKGMPLVWSSGQNIDRLVSIFRACKRSNRQLIVDMYTAAMLRATGNPRVPQAEWEGMRVFLPAGQKRRIITQKAFGISDSFRAFRIFPEEIASVAARSVMLIRPSMTTDLDNANCVQDVCVVCSVWPEYLEDESNVRFVKWMERNSLPLFHCHTSGHATEADLKRLRNAFATAVAVPVHLTEREYFQSAFHRSRLVEDGEWWEVRGILREE